MITDDTAPQKNFHWMVCQAILVSPHSRTGFLPRINSASTGSWPRSIPQKFSVLQGPLSHFLEHRVSIPWMHTSYKQKAKGLKARRQITIQGKMGSRGDQLFVICVCPHSFPVSLTKHNSSFLRVQTIKVLQTCTLAASNKIQGNKKWPVIEQALWQNVWEGK